MALRRSGENCRKAATEVCLAQASAPLPADDKRWVGKSASQIDSDLTRRCAECGENGSVTEINFKFQFIEVIEGLKSHAAHLRSLDLSSNNLSRIEGLGGMAKLKELKLYGCQISRLQGLEDCIALSALHLEDNRIPELSGLENLRALEYLNLDKNRLQKLGRGFARLTKLRELHVSRNQLQDLHGVSCLSSLEVLSASKNQLEKLTCEQIKGLNRLDELHLAGNQLIDVCFLGASSIPSLPMLSILDISANGLTREAISSIPSLLQMTELNLADNNLDSVPPSLAKQFPALELLDLSGNRFEEPKQLENLKDFGSMRELQLKGNPIPISEELLQALANINSLEYLDDEKLPERPRDDPNDNGGDVSPDFSVPQALMDLTGGGTSRPSTGSSRPGTAQNMKEAGVKNPLMHLRSKATDRRCAGADDVIKWERQTLGTLASIDVQVQRTLIMAEGELKTMGEYLDRAKNLVNDKEGLKTSCLLESTMFTDVEQEDTSDEVRHKRVGKENGTVSMTVSKSSSKLREAVISAREPRVLDTGTHQGSDLARPPILPSDVASRTRLASKSVRAVASCDEVFDSVNVVTAVPEGTSLKTDDVDLW